MVIDLYSRRMIGWSMQSKQRTDVVLQALLMAVWRRKPRGKVLIHSDQGSQFTSMDWAAFLRAHNLEHSTSRRGNCHDNAAAESFFNLLKRERIRRRACRNREEARREVFDYIEIFYNARHKHARNGMLSPNEFERQQLDDTIATIALEAGPLSQWLHHGLTSTGLDMVFMETRQVKEALRAMPIKTDRRDAEGIARLLHLGWFRPVHCKSISVQEMRAVLGARKAIQQGMIALALSLRGLLRSFGLKLGAIFRGRLDLRI